MKLFLDVCAGTNFQVIMTEGSERTGVVHSDDQDILCTLFQLGGSYFLPK